MPTNYTLNETAGALGDMFIRDLIGSYELAGILIVLFFLVLLYVFRAGEDVAPVVLIPLITVLATVGFLPDVLAKGVWILAGIVWFLVIQRLLK